MYTFDKNKKQYILRIIKNPADSIGQTKAEMDWLLYLAQKGVTVPSPLKTERGELAFSAEENGETCFISAFNRMDGLMGQKRSEAVE